MRPRRAFRTAIGGRPILHKELGVHGVALIGFAFDRHLKILLRGLLLYVHYLKLRFSDGAHLL